LECAEENIIVVNEKWRRIQLKSSNWYQFIVQGISQSRELLSWLGFSMVFISVWRHYVGI